MSLRQHTKYHSIDKEFVKKLHKKGLQVAWYRKWRFMKLLGLTAPQYLS